MNDLINRLRAADISGNGSYSALVREAADMVDRLNAALNSSPCPRPVNNAPYGLTVEECIKRGECGCDNRAVLAVGRAAVGRTDG